ncbi:diguanylate phosphodiesterase [Actinotalea ferrariae CF5-4]|uniref:Diguanylate phosphodiesterase n=2 Tax=Actinotalea TaxID=458839 RepID=A0A021VQI7_9CELL|nr:diguanylate phosphodiesterase [Actinotalea ferrariae CF5-4]
MAPEDPAWGPALERAVAGEGVSVVAQPIVDVAGARVAGYELLSRFEGPPRATPDLWFEAARAHGLDGALTARTVGLMREVAATRPEGTFWTLNVEPHLLLSPEVSDLLLAPARLDEMVVELTEHVGYGEDPGLARVMAAIRSLGGSIAMDDAGTGYSGLTQMLAVRPDIVKVDRSLVSGLDRDPVRRAAVRLLGDLSGQMDAWLLAEGVETLAELAELAALGVPLVQGWAVGRPGPGWPDLDPVARAALLERGTRAGLGHYVFGLVRPAELRGWPQEDGPEDLRAGEVVVDDTGRPRRVVVADPGGGTHLAPALVVSPSSPPDDVLRRAMARAEEWRHAPVVCTDARGRVMGTIAVVALVDHVLEHGAGT